MENQGGVIIEGVLDPLKSTEVTLDSSHDSEESKKGKKSSFFGAKDAIKKFVKNGSSRSITKANLNAAHRDAFEDANTYIKSNKSNVVYKAINLRSGVRPPPGTKAQEVAHNHSPSETKGRRSRWSRSKTSSPTKQLVMKKMNGKDEPEKVDTKIAKGKDSPQKDTVKIKPSRFKPPQNPTEVDMESVTHMLRLMGITIEGKLGEGTYAKVRSAFNARLGKRVALKIVSRSRLNTRFQKKFLPRELRVLQSIKHDNIIELYQVIDKKDNIIMVMELARHGDLLEYVQKKKALPNNEARTIFSHILNAVEYLHFNGIFHRDLKCENVLLDWGPAGLVAKITDFGFSREWREPYRLCRTYCGSAAYASPEILQGIPYDPHGTDIWSVGVILFIMLSGRMPYDDSNITESLSSMMNNQLDWPCKRPICKEAKDLIGSILRHELRERATIPQIRRSAWMEGRIERVKLPSASVKLSCPSSVREHPESKREMQGAIPDARNAI